MAEFAPVLPTELHSTLGTRYGPHFVHAPQVVQSQQLRKWLIATRGTVFLDCFAFELDGEEPDTNLIYEALTWLKDISYRVTVIVPDVLHNSTRSIELMGKHLPRLWKAMDGGGRVMVVPHGVEFKEWMLCAETMILAAAEVVTIPSRLWIGIPRYTHDYQHIGAYPRRTLARWLSWYFPAIPIHLLGCPAGLGEALAAASASNVVTVDSSSPFTSALEIGYQGPRLSTHKYEMSPRWWDLTEEQLSSVQLQTAMLNIGEWKEQLRNASSYAF